MFAHFNEKKKKWGETKDLIRDSLASELTNVLVLH